MSTSTSTLTQLLHPDPSKAESKQPSPATTTADANADFNTAKSSPATTTTTATFFIANLKSSISSCESGCRSRNSSHANLNMNMNLSTSEMIANAIEVESKTRESPERKKDSKNHMIGNDDHYNLVFSSSDANSSHSPHKPVQQHPRDHGHDFNSDSDYMNIDISCQEGALGLMQNSTSASTMPITSRTNSTATASTTVASPSLHKAYEQEHSLQFDFDNRTYSGGSPCPSFLLPGGNNTKTNSNNNTNTENENETGSTTPSNMSTLKLMNRGRNESMDMNITMDLKSTSCKTNYISSPQLSQIQHVGTPSTAVTPSPKVGVDADAEAEGVSASAAASTTPLLISPPAATLSTSQLQMNMSMEMNVPKLNLLDPSMNKSSSALNIDEHESSDDQNYMHHPQHSQQEEQQQQQNLHQSPRTRSRKISRVQPVVYSAIGSLEKVNQLNLGSFNSKVYRASQYQKQSLQRKQKHKQKHKQSHKDLDSNQGENHRHHRDDNPPNKSFYQPDSNSNSAGPQTSSIDAKTGTSMNKNTHHTDKNMNKPKRKKDKKKKVTIDTKKKEEIQVQPVPVELFRPSCDAYTPRIGAGGRNLKQIRSIKSIPAAERERACREAISTISTTMRMGTIQKPNFRDALRRVAMILQQHIVKIERRFDVDAVQMEVGSVQSGSVHSRDTNMDTRRYGVAGRGSVSGRGRGSRGRGRAQLNLFTEAMRDAFDEENFVTPRYKYSLVNVPTGRAGVVYGMRKIRTEYKIPTADDIYEFAHQLFAQVQLSSECSIICLIYVERLMEVAKVPVLARTWRPIFMCGLLLASKVWQDWASWNIEFASVYPQFSLDAINRLEVLFCKTVKWDLYISSSLYAKYYFALRSLLEKQDFRRRYVQMVGGVDNVAASEAAMISKRSEMMKAKALSHLSMSM